MIFLKETSYHNLIIISFYKKRSKHGVERAVLYQWMPNRVLWGLGSFTETISAAAISNRCIKTAVLFL